MKKEMKPKTPPKILYHGSNKKIKELIPKKPDADLPENSIKAIYATDNKNYALGMSLTSQKGTESFKGNKKINFIKGEPKMKHIYLHYLKPNNFKYNVKDEYISLIPVKPYKIEKYKVSELGHLWRKSSREELKEFLKDRKKWRKNNPDK